jgi:hypothetical protein
VHNYALGLFMASYRELPIVEHDGANFGYRADLLRFPQQKFTVATLCNVSSADVAALSRQVAEIYLVKDLRHVAPASPVPSGSDPALFAGKYFDRRTHFLVSFAHDRGNLLLGDHILEPIERNRFEDPISDATVRFSASDGAMKATVTYNHAITFDGARIEDLHLEETALTDYAGVFRSVELEWTYKLSAGKGKLMLQSGWDPAIEMRPMVADEFNGSGVTLVFRRDNAKRISGFSVFSGWNGVIRNQWFEKLNESQPKSTASPMN